MKKIILNADDFGYRDDVSQAILDSHIKGVLTSTTVLVNFITDEYVEKAKQVNTLGFGLHLNITSGNPLTNEWKDEYGSFTRPLRGKQGEFDRQNWIDFFKDINTEIVFKEYEAQYKQFVKIFDKEPTHIDAHHYSGMYKKTLPAYLELAKKYNLRSRYPISMDWAENQNIEQHAMSKVMRRNDLKETFIKSEIIIPSYQSTEFFHRYKNYLELIEYEISCINDGESIELFWHPGFEEKLRKDDYTMLVSDELKNLLSKHNLVTYGAI
ncbi:MAG: ChbG/HpnK family deacetylase [Candidatus Dojkabacteria bacterium]|nr:ChbG/HpnK family deacetylase [Candidatus Dojkabacteria bacterium]MDQ7021782.1 ChbG/HpnK family deacetylase [Candidatus Dojkabacteria bacterium]